MSIKFITNEPAIMLPGKVLVIADLHIGAEYEFRRAGIKIPSQTKKLLEKTITALAESEFVQGFYIWQFCDGRTALSSDISIGRPRNFNNKGLVDEHRKPKLSYYAVKKMLKKISTYK